MPPQTLGRMILNYAEKQPERTAITFRPRPEQRLAHTYASLARAACRYAHALKSFHNQPVVVIFPSGLELVEAIFGAWIAGAIAVPVMPPRPGRRGDRLAGILRDVNAAAIVTCRNYLEAIADLRTKETLILVEELPAAEATINDHARADDIALLQYTSGSISSPKGVMLTHANILANQRQITSNFGSNEETIVAGWLPMHHDMGLIGNVIHPLYLGNEVHLIPPESFLMRPVRWLELLTETRATTSGGPNFAYDLCVSRISSDVMQRLDLSNWRVAFNGAEPVRAQTLARFFRHAAPARLKLEALHPCYGLAEASLIVTGKPAGSAPRFINLPGEDTPRVSSGVSVPETEVIIAHPETAEPLPPGEIGEVWVRGPSVAAGYWPDRKLDVFGQSLASGDSGWMRTGDLGALLDGELVVTGRLKDIIIIGGQNFIAEDIEAAVQEIVGLGSDTACAAFAVDGPAGETLVIAIETPDIDGTLAPIIGKGLTERFDVVASHLRFVPRGRLPRTTSGKIRRGETRRLFLANETPFGSKQS